MTRHTSSLVARFSAMWVLIAGCAMSTVSAGTVTVTEEVSITIPDGDLTGTLVSINVSGVPEGQGIQDLNVVLSIDGTIGFNGDLYAYLTKTDNAAFAVLLNRPGRSPNSRFGSAGSGLSRLVFDDEATNGDIHLYEDVIGESAIFGLPWEGAWQPDGRLVDPGLVTGTEPRVAMLNQFDGVSPNGDWLLFLADVSPGGLMTLTHWTLEFEVDTPVTSFSGIASDGLVAGGTVYFDANLNGVLDQGEPWVLTNSTGAYQLNVLPGPFDQNGDGILSASEGVLVMSGGTDIATGLPIEISFRAPLGATVIHPLTTLIARLLIRDPNLSAADAEARVETALGLDAALAARVNLLEFDMFAEAARGNPDAVALVNAVAHVQDTVVQVGDFVSGVNGVARVPVIELAFEQLVDDLIAGKTLEMTSTARVKELVSTVDGTLWNGLNENQKDVAAEIIAANNTFKQAVTNSGDSVVSRVQKLAQTQVQVQTEIASDLRQAGLGQLSLQDALVKNTFGNLEAAVNGGPVGNVLGNVTDVGTFSFDQLGYEVTEEGKALHPITVIREGGSAGTVRLLVTPNRGTADATDFVDQPIEVDFAPFEIRKTIDASSLIRNDTVVEGSETMGLSLGLRAGHPNGAALGTQSAAQLSIVDDDTPGTVSFSAGPFVIREDGKVITPITLVRTDGSDGFLPVVVQMEAVTGGATLGSDLVGGNFLVTFEDGNLNQTLDVIILDDILMEPDEQVRLRLQLAPQAPANAALGTRSTATLTIQNDDPNNVPVLSQIADQRILEDRFVDVAAFTLTDLEHDPNQIQLTASSSNTALVEKSGLVFGGQGENRTLSVYPNRDANGEVTISVSANDGFDTTVMSFDLTVLPLDDSPTIEPLQDIVVQSGGDVVTSRFEFVDVDTAAADIDVLFFAETPEILPVSALKSIGSGFSREIQVTPPQSGTGRADFILYVDDGSGVGSRPFSVFLIEEGKPAPPNTPRVSVSLGEIDDVVLNEDASLKLPLEVSVEGEAVGGLSLSLAGDNETLLTAASATFEEEDGRYSVVLKPGVNAHGAVNLVLTVSLAGVQASQAFRMTVLPVDDPPEIDLVESLVLDEDTTGQVTLIVSDPDTAAADIRVELVDSGNPVMLPGGSIRIQQEALSFPIEIAPRSNVFGTARLQFKVSDASSTIERGLDLSVLSVNDPPTIMTEPIVEILEGNTASIEVGIQDVDTALANLEIAVRSLNEAIVPTSGLLLQGEGASRQLGIVPLPDQFGELVVEIEAREGPVVTTKSLSVRVIQQNDSPHLGPLSAVVMTEDDSTVVELDFSDRDTPREDLTLAVSASNELLFSEGSLNLELAGGLDRLHLQPVTDGEGESEITVSVSDGVNRVEQLFRVTVEGVNDAPRILGLEDIKLTEGERATIRFSVSDPDDDVGEILVVLATVNPELLVLPQVVQAGDGGVREFELKLTEGQSGRGEVIVGASDGKLISTSRFGVEVTPLIPVLPDPARLAIRRRDGALVISWEPSGVLMSSESVNGPFEVVVDATNPHIVPPNEAQRFFQVISPLE